MEKSLDFIDFSGPTYIVNVLDGLVRSLFPVLTISHDVGVAHHREDKVHHAQVEVFRVDLIRKSLV